MCCGAVADLPGQVPAPTLALPAGFVVESRRLEYVGVCAACRCDPKNSRLAPTGADPESPGARSAINRKKPKKTRFHRTAVMPDNTFDEEFKLSDFRGKYVVLFFYPLDFTFVCPSEIIAFDKALEEFKERNCEVIGVSVDSHFTHLAWKNTPVEKGGIGQVKYPLVADLTKKISPDYGVLFDDGIALRGLFLIDKKGIVRHARQRPAAGPQRRRGPAHARRPAVHRGARRGLPGQLEEGRRGHEAHRRRRGVVPEEAQLGDAGAMAPVNEETPRCPRPSGGGWRGVLTFFGAAGATSRSLARRPYWGPSARHLTASTS